MNPYHPVILVRKQNIGHCIDKICAISVIIITCRRVIIVDKYGNKRCFCLNEYNREFLDNKPLEWIRGEANMPA